MAIRPKTDAQAPHAEELELLQQLIATPPTPKHGWQAPVALRSTDEQRSHALRGYLLRTWFDGVLHHSERLLAVAALIVFGFWAYDGPLRDWMHQNARDVGASPVQAAVLQATSIPVGQAKPVVAAHTLNGSAPLPFTTPAMSQPIDDAFIAPGSAHPAAAIETAPQPTRLVIPAIGLDTDVREVFVRDGAWEVADYAAGYMHGTALPGEQGTMALAGHAGLRGGVFRDLGALQLGDDVVVDAGGWRYRYRIRESFRVWPTQTDVLAPSADQSLILITCTNWDTQRLIVRADLVESKPIPST